MAELHGKGAIARAPLQRRLGVDTTVPDVQITDGLASSSPLLQDLLRLGGVLEEVLHTGLAGNGSCRVQGQRGRRRLLELLQRMLAMLPGRRSLPKLLLHGQPRSECLAPGTEIEMVVIQVVIQVMGIQAMVVTHSTSTRIEVVAAGACVWVKEKRYRLGMTFSTTTCSSTNPNQFWAVKSVPKIKSGDDNQAPGTARYSRVYLSLGDFAMHRPKRPATTPQKYLRSNSHTLHYLPRPKTGASAWSPLPFFIQTGNIRYPTSRLRKYNRNLFKYRCENISAIFPLLLSQ